MKVRKFGMAYMPVIEEADIERVTFDYPRQSDIRVESVQPFDDGFAVLFSWAEGDE